MVYASIAGFHSQGPQVSTLDFLAVASDLPYSGVNTAAGRPHHTRGTRRDDTPEDHRGRRFPEFQRVTMSLLQILDRDFLQGYIKIGESIGIGC